MVPHQSVSKQNGIQAVNALGGNVDTQSILSRTQGQIIN